jgi:hypothetical protein
MIELSIFKTNPVILAKTSFSSKHDGSLIRKVYLSLRTVYFIFE